MASNPVFGRIDKQIQQGQYAGFGGAPRQAQPAPGQQPQFGQGQYGQQPQYGQPGPPPGFGQPTPSPQQLEQMYGQGTAGPVQTGRMTLDDVMMKFMGLFGLVIVFAGGAWIATDQVKGLSGPLLLGGIVATLGLGLVIAFKKTISVPLIVAYAVVEGLFVGTISNFYNDTFGGGSYGGIIGQAILATLCVFAVMFGGWKAGFIKVTARSRRIFGMALMGYLLFAVVNLVFAMVSGQQFGIGGGGPLGIGISIFAVGLASYSLAIDFDSIERAIEAGVPQKTSWLMAHGLVVSVVWLYLEILRLLAQLQSSD